jgi:hypothetical protein
MRTKTFSEVLNKPMNLSLLRRAVKKEYYVMVGYDYAHRPTIGTLVQFFKDVDSATLIVLNDKDGWHVGITGKYVRYDRKSDPKVKSIILAVLATDKSLHTATNKALLRYMAERRV